MIHIFCKNWTEHTKGQYILDFVSNGLHLDVIKWLTHTLSVKKTHVNLRKFKNIVKKILFWQHSKNR